MARRHKIKESAHPNKDRASYLVPALVVLIVGIVTPYLTYQWGLRTQIEATGKQRRQQAYSELLGRKAIMSQLLVSRFEALAYSDYHEARWKVSGAPKESIDLQEAQRWMHKSEDLALEIAKSKQSLFETLGLIRGSFRHDSTLDALVDRVQHFKNPEIIKRPFGLDAGQMEVWKVNVVKQLQDLVENEFSKPMDELASYLTKEISADAV